MGRFSELNTNINHITELLLGSENLLKLIANDTDNPLASTPIQNPSSLLFTRIFPQPKMDFSVQNKQTMLTYVLSDIKLEDIKFKEGKIIFNIICPIELWKINEGIRPYLILEELDIIFNELRSNKLSIGKVLFGNMMYREYSNYYCGFYVTYNIAHIN